MAKKPDGRKAKKQKQAENTDKKPQPRREKPQKVKVLGPRPKSYSPNPERAQARQEQEEVEARKASYQRDLERLRALAPSFKHVASGVHGDYTIALDIGTQVFFHDYTVDVRSYPAKENLPANEKLAIVDRWGNWVDHNYLFLPKEKCYLGPGKLGEIQARMLDFLRAALIYEIEDVRTAWEENRRAKLAGKHLRLATSNGNPVESTMPSLPLASYTPETVGSFNFADGSLHCNIVQKPFNGVMRLTIMSMNNEHRLAKQGVRVGLWMCTETLEALLPETARNDLGDEHVEHIGHMKGFLLERLEQARALKAA